MAVIVCLVLAYFAAAIILYIRIRLLGEVEHRERRLRVTRHVWLRRRCGYLVLMGVLIAVPAAAAYTLINPGVLALNGTAWGVLGVWCQNALYIMLLVAIFYLLSMKGKMLLAFFGNLLFYLGIAYLFGFMGAVSALSGPLPIIVAEFALLVVLLAIFRRLFLKMDFVDD